jgi:hypothetical protein
MRLISGHRDFGYGVHDYDMPRALDESDLLVCEASTLWYTPQSIAVCQVI